MVGSSFGERNFGQVQLGDKRRTHRLVTLVDTMCRHPGGTLPDKFNHPPDLRAFYNLMNRPEVTHPVLIASHAAETHRRIADLPAGQVVLHLHDATELDFTSKTTLQDHLGQIGQGSRRGYICHNSLSVRADTGETLGLLSQILHHRADVPKGETTKEKREREDRESRLWIHGAAACGIMSAGVLGIDVSDSLSDTFEYMAYEVTQKRGFVLRAKENRTLEKPLNGEGYLLDAVRSLPAQGNRTIKVLPSPQREGRTVTGKVSFAAVDLAVPRKHLGEYAKVPLSLWVVRIWEPNPPPGEDPLEWILLTNAAVETVADAQVRADWYECRPIVEELHKGMKTGCSIETMQFEKIERLEPAIAVLSAVTTTLLRLRDAARAADAETRPAQEVIDTQYVEVLSNHYGKKLGPKPSVKRFYMYVARLGGHQNRKCDGFPGWITLWRGWMKLQSMVDGYRAAMKKLIKQSGKT
jgi:hypothetical protein